MIHGRIGQDKLEDMIAPIYGSADLEHDVPKYHMPQKAMPPRHAYNIVYDEIMLDGNSRLNLATFVSTWMEPEAKDLIMQSLDKNMIDKDEYPQTAEIEKRCVNIMAHLWNAKAGGDACGCSTVGSSEAAMLGGMALKWNWKKKQAKAGKDISKPNLIMSEGVQVCWEKFCRYWEVEPRTVPFEKDCWTLTPQKVVELCDENTIGVIPIMGTTMTGQYEPVQGICAALDQLQQEKGLNIPVHVDAASGGFVAPFLDPDIVWDFRLERVKSINCSGHKYGLVYPGVGWVVWRNQEDLPEELVFKVNYLGGNMPTFALNFSRPGAQILAQYYNFLRLGYEGYREIHGNCRQTAEFLSEGLEKMGCFTCLTRGNELPVIALKIREDANVNFSVFDVSEEIRRRGWLVPAYTLAENAQDVAVLRIVIKNGFSMDMAQLLLDDIQRANDKFAADPRRKIGEHSANQKPDDNKYRKHC